jgi:hypothetical protein
MSINLHLTGGEEQRIRDLAGKALTTPATYAHEIISMWLFEHRSGKPLARDPMDYTARNGDGTEECSANFREQLTLR